MKKCGVEFQSFPKDNKRQKLCCIKKKKSVRLDFLPNRDSNFQKSMIKSLNITSFHLNLFFGYRGSHYTQ